jgi:hypothetical protein
MLHTGRKMLLRTVKVTTQSRRTKAGEKNKANSSRKDQKLKKEGGCQETI